MGRKRRLLAATAVALVAGAAPASAAVVFGGTFGARGSGNGQFLQPRGLAVDSAGNVYVGDSGNSRVQKFSRSGGFLGKWGSEGSAPGQFGQASTVGLAVAGSTVLVVDRNNHRVQRFTLSGGFIRTFGGFGLARGRLSAPQGVAVDGAGNVYVSEYSNNRISKFTSTGGFLTAWGSRGSGNGQFELPADVAVDGAGNVYVSDTGNDRIQKFTGNGAFLGRWGGTGSGNGQLRGPLGLTVGSDQTVFVADAFNRRIQQFSTGGTFLGGFGSRGSGPGQFLTAPTEVAARGGDIYVADTAAHRVVRFSSGPPAPALGRAVNVRAVRGRVSVRVPGARRAVLLRAARQVRVGSVLDTRRGTVRLTSARNSRGGTQTSDFSAGVFQVRQSRRRSARGLTELRMRGGSFRNCTARSSALVEASRRTRRRIRRLRGRGRGRFRTRGHYASATVRGTTWTVTDRCDGTLTTVSSGRVAVRDFRRRRTVPVRAGRRYFARAPG